MQATGKFTQEADFRRERDFGAKVGASFEFLVAQFRPLFKCLAYFVLPPALLGGIGAGLFMGNFLSALPTVGKAGGAPQIAPGYPANMFTASSFLGIGLAIMGFLVAFLLLSSVVYGFVRVRMSNPPHETVQPAQVWAVVRQRMGRTVGAWVLLTVVLVVGSSLLTGLLALVGPAFVVFMFVPLAWIMVCLTLYFPVLMMEEGGVLAALRRSFYLIKGKWWSSFGLYFVMSLITGVVNYVFIIPFYGLMAARMLLKIPGLDSDILSVGAMSIYALGWIFTATLPLVAMLFQYFNLVERKDGVGLRLMVNSLGTAGAPQVRNALYQPDEEGEY